MKLSRKFKLGLGTIVVAYLALFLFTPNSESRDPYYPISLWKLWAHVPSSIQECDIQIWENETFLTWKNVERMARVARHPHTPPILNQWAKLGQRKDMTEFHVQRPFMESRLLRGEKSLRYKIICSNLDPVRFWKERKYESQITVGDFVSGKYE